MFKRPLSSSSRALQQVSKASQSKKFNLSDLEFGKLSKAQIAYLDRVIRVDQSGELGANLIYNAQYVVLANRYPHLKPVLQHMWDQELHHYSTFNDLQVRRRVRPSLLTPLWKVGAVGLGAVTALISKEAAMACTVAVETVIGNHYNEQLRVLMNQYDVPIYEKNTGEVISKESLEMTLRTSPELRQLKEFIKEFRDEELEHLETAIEHDAKKAVPYMLLTETIKLLCHGAIYTAERV
ncbi:ubiquinone biosynthesis protein COQ7 [Yamadazyma tenuis ATCC 10573]|uniref:5-demethoxyubiquinone hydroxylase, mitochondrial n=1 Tax=Candida tenuis (strain ATCC 10573 / BCRC 21748 / CBS 615 / JCM 9827 / NBRC 10315 / NRRL Y-1498 / VKM Y-70) TaxID=590646 RepID=G3B5F3_CANTC|nr:ubiquinone biosynthesis protein COQ7 [Yamadazyma tenuis ATCC 10573]EGV63208.1 ubiquinone biosynthesis protein COQ7 [Yamadazyma tenuis ATCC 10573]